jgi:hypothetical protein
MKRCYPALLLVLSLAAAGCSTTSSLPTTPGVDDAPEIIKNTYLVVSSQAATLAGYDATSSEFLDFARRLCDAGLESEQDLGDFVDDWAGPTADQAVVQMWSTAAGAATSSFCPVG